MPHYICKMNGDVVKDWTKGQTCYIVWSEVVDAPITYGMNLEELRNWLIDNGEFTTEEAFQQRMGRVEKYGTSCATGPTSFEEMVRYNRAGDNETTLSLEELVEAYWEPSRL